MLPPEPIRDQWTTPRWMVRLLEDRCGGAFELDVAAAEHNAVAPLFYTRERSALDMAAWLPVRRAFCNPPFRQLRAFIELCMREVIAARRIETLGIVTLADVSTRYWRLLEEAGAERVRFEGGRWSCEPPAGVAKSSPRAAMQAWILRQPMTVADAELRFAPPGKSKQRSGK